MLKVGLVLKVFVPLNVLVPFWVASVEGSRAALMVELLALMAVTTLSPADALTLEAVVAVVAVVAVSAVVAVAAVVAVEALPLSVAVMVPAAKLPEASRLTIVSAVLLFVAEFAALAPLATVAAFTPPTVLTIVELCVPLTSPAKDPEKFAAEVAVLAVVAVAALPLRSAVIVPAEKLPEASRLTMVLAVLLFVAALAAPAPLATLAALAPPILLTTVADCVPVTSPESVPLKLVALAAVVAVVAVEAFPLSSAVIVFAVKLPEASRLTIAFGALVSVAPFAVVTAEATFVALCPPTLDTTVAPCVPVTSPVSEPLKLAAVVAIVAIAAFKL